MSKIIKNISSASGFYYGVTVPSGTSYEIEPLELGGFQVDERLIEDIASGYTSMIDSLEPTVEYVGYPGIDFLQKDPQRIAFKTAEKTGFKHPIPCTCNDFNSSLSFDDLTRTFSIEPRNGGYEFFIDNIEYFKDTLEDFQIDDEEGLWFFYFTKDGNITGTQEVWDYKDQAWIAYIYWDSTNGQHLIIGEERHGAVMDWSTHQRLHRITNTVIEEPGFELIGVPSSQGGDLDSEAQFGIGDGFIHDEDIIMNIKHADTPANPFEQVLNPIAFLPGFYIDGSGEGVWRKLPSTAFALAYDSPNPAKYNYYNPGTDSWSLVNATDGYYIVSWLVFTNNRPEPVAYLVGQREDETLIEAISNNKLEELNYPILPFQESVFYRKLVFETKTTFTNTPKAVLRAVKTSEIEIESSDRYNVIGWYNGNANKGKIIELYPGIASTSAPFVFPEFSYIRTVTLNTSALSTGTLGFFKLPDLVNPVFTLSLVNSDYIRQNYTIPFAADEEIAIIILAGNLNKPAIRFWIQTSL